MTYRQYVIKVSRKKKIEDRKQLLTLAGDKISKTKKSF